MKRILPLLFMILVSCNNETKLTLLSASADSTILHEALPYDFENPAVIYELPVELEEISGIAAIDDKHIACVQDERGAVYLYDLGRSVISHEILFKEKGDFEGLAYANGILYALQSNGNIYQVSDLKASIVKEVRYDTHLKQDHDTEGLCFDKKNKRLLIACKDKGEDGRHDRKSIYSFDPLNGNVSAFPVYSIDLREIEKLAGKANIRISALGNPMEEIFMPSDIAIHPKTDQIYVISSKNRLLAILNRQGNLLGVYELSHKGFVQAEGITFAANGDLYISNEGKFTKPTILKFTYDQK